MMPGMTVNQKGISIPRNTYLVVKVKADAAKISVSAWLDGAARGRIARESAAAYADVVAETPITEQLTAFREVISGARAMHANPTVDAPPRRRKRYGEVWQIDGVLALIVSSDEYNEHPESPAHVVAVLPGSAMKHAEPFIVATTAGDPITGSIMVPEMQPGVGLTATAELVGVMSPTTMMGVADGMRSLLEL
jgi:hypothetical protein